MSKFRHSNRSKRNSHSCRNNGSCAWCERSRMHQVLRDTQESIDELIDNSQDYRDCDGTCPLCLPEAYN